MGLSVGIASAIVLIGWLAFAGTVSTAMFTSLNDALSMMESTSYDELKVGVQLKANITSVESRGINFTVSNTGSKEIFLRNETCLWNSVIISYNNTDWQTYLIEDYTVLSVNVTGTSASFDVASHPCIKPGEEASIEATLPSGAPDILETSIVTVVFASHYGVGAIGEIYVEQYGEFVFGGESGQSFSIFTDTIG
ncbi:MAG TPA: hypothetical protein VIH48_02775 [Candidatus Bathyarchaeia archaeon]